MYDICIVDSESEYNSFIKYLSAENTIIINLVPDINGLPFKYQVSWLSMMLFDSRKLYIFDTDNIYNLLNNINNINNKINILINNIKYINKFYKINYKNNIVDIEGLNFCKNKNELHIPEELTSYKQYKIFISSRFSKYTVPPITILSELEYNKILYLYDIYTDCKEYINSSEYNSYILRSYNFNTIENNGIHINNNIQSNLTKGNINSIIFPEYNICASESGRTSCSYFSVNLMALNKSSGIRKTFTSRFKNGKLYYFDMESFHPRIVAHLINYNIPENCNFYKHIFNDNITEEYDKLKEKTFQILYGHSTDIGNNEFFNTVSEYKKNKKYSKTLLNREVNNTSSKSFNYFIQKFEVDYINLAMKKINDFLEDKNSKLVLYQYDAILCDIHPTETELVKNIKYLLESVIPETIFPCRVFSGDNFHDVELEK